MSKVVFNATVCLIIKLAYILLFIQPFTYSIYFFSRKNSSQFDKETLTKHCIKAEE